MFVFTEPHATFKQLGPSILGENLNKFHKLCIFPEIYFMLKDHLMLVLVTKEI